MNGPGILATKDVKEDQRYEERTEMRSLDLRAIRDVIPICSVFELLQFQQPHKV